MAFTATKIKEDIVGTAKVQVYECSLASVTSGHIPTGLANVLFATFNNETSEDGKLEKNRNAADDAAERGGVLLDGFTANDIVTVFVYGY